MLCKIFTKVVAFYKYIENKLKNVKCMNILWQWEKRKWELQKQFMPDASVIVFKNSNKPNKS